MEKKNEWLIAGELIVLLLAAAAGRMCSGGVLSACLCILAAADALLLYGIRIAPQKRETEYLREICRNEDWETFMEDSRWKKISGHEQLEEIMEQRAAIFRREEEKKDYERRAALQKLQSQINPHFLYNTLESIRGQAVLDGNTEVGAMLETLSDFFRYSISRRDPLVTLREEINNTGNYIRIQNYRFGNRFRFDVFMEEEECLDCYVPKLILQPILENAMLHGFEHKRNGEIRITAELSTSLLIVTVSDNGDGMDKKTLETLQGRIRGTLDGEETKDRHAHVALPNIDRRIRLIFGKEYGIEVYSTLGKGTDVEVILPCRIKRGDCE